MFHMAYHTTNGTTKDNKYRHKIESAVITSSISATTLYKYFCSEEYPGVY